MQNKFIIGSVVKAITGRESDELFIVTALDQDYAMLVNGKTRKLEKPKRKNIKHIYLLLKETPLKELLINNKATDAHIISLLKKYKNNELGGN